MFNKCMIKVFFLVSTFLLISGCQSQNEDIVIEKKHKKITVLTGNEEVVTNELALEKIDRYEGIRGTDWLDGHTILTEQKNMKLPKSVMTDNGDYTYHINLFSYDLNTNKSQVLASEEHDQVGAVISPDKKHIFYKQTEDGNSGTGYIINSEGTEKVKVSEPDAIYAFATEGRWIDNQTIIYSTIFNQMYSANLNGQVKRIDPNSDKVNLIRKKYNEQKVEWVIPSQDQKQFAIVRKIAATKRELFITDENGRKTVSLATGTQIFGAGWSPNSKTLAFSVISEDKGERGLYVIDVKSRKITQLSTDLDEIAGPITWSPSGKKILVSKVMLKDNLNEFVTYVLTLKN
ncbi:TolB family protein [Gottfriedia sp. NPDC058432]|uniref:TolB family protein n=1 Tax=unclassified Gottfriedia TaxID=2837516 RepID=UPI003668C13D